MPWQFDHRCRRYCRVGGGGAGIPRLLPKALLKKSNSCISLGLLASKSHSGKAVLRHTLQGGLAAVRVVVKGAHVVPCHARLAEALAAGLQVQAVHHRRRKEVLPARPAAQRGSAARARHASRLRRCSSAAQHVRREQRVQPRGKHSRWCCRGPEGHKRTSSAGSGTAGRAAPRCIRAHGTGTAAGRWPAASRPLARAPLPRKRSRNPYAVFTVRHKGYARAAPRVPRVRATQAASSGTVLRARAGAVK